MSIIFFFQPLASDLWNGEGRGYLIQYKQNDEKFFYRTIEVEDENANSYTFGGLEEWMSYGVRVASFNKVGNSAYSPIAVDRTRESGTTKYRLKGQTNLHTMFHGP